MSVTLSCGDDEDDSARRERQMETIVDASPWLYQDAF
jgi:hypothetical protein